MMDKLTCWLHHRASNIQRYAYTTATIDCDIRIDSTTVVITYTQPVKQVVTLDFKQEYLTDNRINAMLLKIIQNRGV